MTPIRRKDALLQGLNKYYTGKPCKRNHTSERYTDSGVCITCLRESVDRHRTINREVVNDRVRRWRIKNPTYHITHYAAHSERSRELTNRWKHQNPDRVALMVDRRGDKLRRATPGWVENDLIRLLYTKRDALSARWGVELTVDHIIPIQSNTVCGLHCWANLQLITREDNGRKHARYQQDW